ncbi:hypothetical protein BTI679_08090 [Bacillus wiedmannii]|nr:hypothetical protein BTI679_08090 [Bacillus wiedmannii]
MWIKVCGEVIMVISSVFIQKYSKELQVNEKYS